MIHSQVKCYIIVSVVANTKLSAQEHIWLTTKSQLLFIILFHNWRKRYISLNLVKRDITFVSTDSPTSLLNYFRHITDVYPEVADSKHWQLWGCHFPWLECVTQSSRIGNLIPIATMLRGRLLQKRQVNLHKEI